MSTLKVPAGIDKSWEQKRFEIKSFFTIFGKTDNKSRSKSLLHDVSSLSRIEANFLENTTDMEKLEIKLKHREKRRSTSNTRMPSPNRRENISSPDSDLKKRLVLEMQVKEFTKELKQAKHRISNLTEENLRLNLYVESLEQKPNRTINNLEGELKKLRSQQSSLEDDIKLLLFEVKNLESIVLQCSRCSSRIALGKQIKLTSLTSDSNVDKDLTEFREKRFDQPNGILKNEIDSLQFEEFVDAMTKHLLPLLINHLNLIDKCNNMKELVKNSIPNALQVQYLEKLSRTDPSAHPLDTPCNSSLLNTTQPKPSSASLHNELIKRAASSESHDLKQSAGLLKNSSSHNIHSTSHLNSLNTHDKTHIEDLHLSDARIMPSQYKGRSKSFNSKDKFSCSKKSSMSEENNKFPNNAFSNLSESQNASKIANSINSVSDCYKSNETHLNALVLNQLKNNLTPNSGNKVDNLAFHNMLSYLRTCSLLSFSAFQQFDLENAKSQYTTESYNKNSHSGCAEVLYDNDNGNSVRTLDSSNTSKISKLVSSSDQTLDDFNLNVKSNLLAVDKDCNSNMLQTCDDSNIENIWVLR